MVWLVVSGHLAEAGEVSSVQLEGRAVSLSLGVSGPVFCQVLQACLAVWTSTLERGDTLRGCLSPAAGEGGGRTWSKTVDHLRVPPSQRRTAATHRPFPGEVSQTSLVPADILAPGAPSLSPDLHPQGVVVD